MSHNILDSVKHDAPDAPVLVAKSLLPRATTFERSLLHSRLVNGIRGTCYRYSR
jgi:hypothetical protein